MAKSLIRLVCAASLALPLCPAQVWAGDGGEPRREFRQSNVYPYIFQPVSYLETGGPKVMRFAQAQAECAHRDAPLLPAPTPTPTPASKAVTKNTDQKDTAAAATPAPAQATASPVPPAYPPPDDAPAAGGPDLTKMPEEVMSYFKNPYNVGPRGPHLFDPIFEPGYHQGPASKATYQLSDKP